MNSQAAVNREQTVTRRRVRPDGHAQPELTVVTGLPPRVVTRYERFGKRAFDIVFSLVLLVVLLPLLAATALAVRLSMGRGVLYLQDRVGRHGRTFRIYKFRSMREDRRRAPDPVPVDGQDRRQTHKTDEDPRHTKVGRIIRKLSLDELPQLLNILRGDMSLVGPRPELVSVAKAHDMVAHPRHQVRPGLTGPWQLSQWRDRPIYEHLEPDETYVEKLTLRKDLGYLLRTVGAVFGASGH
jgi:lipopolysaccharide/colanic/teichoic acid biosynthesis glycosyltransferase